MMMSSMCGTRMMMIIGGLPAVLGLALLASLIVRVRVLIARLRRDGGRATAAGFTAPR